MNVVLIGIIVYVALQLVLGFVISRKIHTESDFLLAGRKLGYWLAVFSIFGTWFGAETCIGTAGAAYSDGLAGVTADPFGYSICLFLMGLLLAVPLWRLKITTIADFFRLRYSVLAERTVAVIIVPASVLWAAAQIRAFGQVLSASSELTLGLAIVIATTVVIIYTVSGGLLADAMTDIIQGAILIIGLVILAFVINSHLDGIFSALAALPDDKLSFVSEAARQSDWTALELMEAWAVPICGSLVAQELVARVIASRSPKVARRSTFIAASMYISVGLMPLAFGLVGSTMIVGLEFPEQILPKLAQQHLPSLGYVIFAGALVSAILSTVDSALLAATALISHNVIIPLRPAISERQKLLIERCGVVVFGIIAFALALAADGVYALVEEASAFGSAGVFIVVLIGLFTRFGGPRSAMTALLAGVVVYFLAAFVLALPYSYLLSIAAALGGYLAVGFFEDRGPSMSMMHAKA